MSRPLFTSGTARGGTNLRAQILSVNKDVRLASDPFLPLFRELRNAILLKSGDQLMREWLDLDSPLDDYYFCPMKLKALQYIQKARAEDIPFSEPRWARLKDLQSKRMSLASADLIPYLDLLPGKNFLEALDNAVKIVRRARKGEECSWVGFNENWAIEFFPLLARAFPEAKFMIFLRDPRGAIDGALRAETDPGKIPHVLSFARHWRKYVAFVCRLTRDPLFDQRLFVSTFESLVADPLKVTTEMCTFLQVSFDPAMVNTENFRTATGGAWSGTWDIYRNALGEWEEQLSKAIIETIEFVCDPDMELFGYQPAIWSDFRALSEEAVSFVLKDSSECRGWRSDFKAPEKDLGFEFFRKNIISIDSGQYNIDLLRRCFIFDEAYNRVRSISGVLLQDRQ